MKLFTSVVFVVMLIAGFSCKPKNNPILSSFRIVNEMHDKNSQMHWESMEQNIEAIRAQREKDSGLVAVAENIFYACDSAGRYLKACQLLLRNTDTAGTKMDVANRLLLEGPHGDTLAAVLLNLLTSFKSYPEAGSKKTGINFSISNLERTGVGNWRSVTFKKTFTAAAYMQLGSLRNDAYTASNLILQEIAGELYDATHPSQTTPLYTDDRDTTPAKESPQEK